jgi:hypothetical protein
MEEYRVFNSKRTPTSCGKKLFYVVLLIAWISLLLWRF